MLIFMFMFISRAPDRSAADYVVLAVCVCVCVCLTVCVIISCEQNIYKSYKQSLMKFAERWSVARGGMD